MSFSRNWLRNKHFRNELFDFCNQINQVNNSKKGLEVFPKISKTFSRYQTKGYAFLDKFE